MIQSFRQLKDRIKSIEGTRKITRAMEMVSASKLNHAKAAFLSAKPYASDMERVFNDLLVDIKPDHPLLERREKVNRITLVVMASDTGLCSAYNNNIIRFAAEFADRIGKAKIDIIPVGKEPLAHFSREGYAIVDPYIGVRGKFSEGLAADITRQLTDIFLTRRADEIYLAYTHFSPNLRHRPAVEKFFNIEYKDRPRQYYILEPGREAIWVDLLNRYLLSKIRSALLDSFTAEHSARMLAMKLATDNADELIDTLTLQKNKARQFAITKEVLEIAMSAEALKG